MLPRSMPWSPPLTRGFPGEPDAGGHRGASNSTSLASSGSSTIFNLFLPGAAMPKPAEPRGGQRDVLLSHAGLLLAVRDVLHGRYDRDSRPDDLNRRHLSSAVSPGIRRRSVYPSLIWRPTRQSAHRHPVRGRKWTVVPGDGGSNFTREGALLVFEDLRPLPFRIAIKRISKNYRTN